MYHTAAHQTAAAQIDNAIQVSKEYRLTSGGEFKRTAIFVEGVTSHSRMPVLARLTIRGEVLETYATIEEMRGAYRALLNAGWTGL